MRSAIAHRPDVVAGAAPDAVQRDRDAGVVDDPAARVAALDDAERADRKRVVRTRRPCRAARSTRRSAYCRAAADFPSTSRRPDRTAAAVAVARRIRLGLAVRRAACDRAACDRAAAGPAAVVGPVSRTMPPPSPAQPRSPSSNADLRPPPTRLPIPGPLLPDFAPPRYPLPRSPCRRCTVKQSRPRIGTRAEAPRSMTIPDAQFVAGGATRYHSVRGGVAEAADERQLAQDAARGGRRAIAAQLQVTAALDARRGARLASRRRTRT